MEVISSFKYLGTYIDDKFNSVINVDSVCKKIIKESQFLYRMLSDFGVGHKVLDRLYVKCIMSKRRLAIVKVSEEKVQKESYLIPSLPPTDSS